MAPIRQRWRAACVSAAALLVLLALAEPAAAHVFWVEGQSPTGRNDHIGRANLDATMVERGFISGYGMDGVTGVAVNASHVYWTNDHGFVDRANLDGTGIMISWNGAGGSDIYKGVALGPQDLYWADQTQGRIGSAKLDGSDWDGFYVTGATAPQGVAISGNYLYWGNGDHIGRYDITTNPAGADQSFLSAHPLGLAADATHLYWIEAGAIYRTGLDGNGKITLIAQGCGAAPTCGIAVNGAHVYWTRYDVGAIGRANLDGSGVDPGFITGLSHPTGVALDGGRTPVPPGNTSYPALTGTAQVGQTLGCSTGSWSGDGPLTYAFRWLRDGAAIAGATAATYLLTPADAATTVQCEVTATGPGGAATQATAGVAISRAEVLPTAPASIARPSVVGNAVAGTTETCSPGVWTGSEPMTLTYQWLLDGNAIPNATRASYVTATSQAGRLLACRVTARNSAGSAVGTSPARRLLDRTAPRLIDLSISPRSFSRGRTTTVRYWLSEAATLRVTAERYDARSHRYVAVKGSLTVRGRRGAASFRFKGRFATGPLAAGRYHLVIVARDAAGNAGRATRSGFTVRS